MGQRTGASFEAGVIEPVQTINAKGRSPFVLACDHASNRFPEPYGDLGLAPYQRLMHVAWDPGALAVALRLSDLLDAPLVASTVSRLVIDCNRHFSAADLIPTISERTEIPGNRGIGDTERRVRIAAFHEPFHAALEEVLDGRRARGEEAILVTVHSFTPIYKDVPRPWPIGLIHARDERFTRDLQAALLDDAPGLNVGWNQPYSALSGVTYTLEHHGDERGIPATMLEIRHDEILEPDGIALWAGRLARCLTAARGERSEAAA